MVINVIVEYGYTTEDKWYEFVAEVNAEWAIVMENISQTGYTLLPDIYICFKHFNVKKEDYLEYREKQYEEYLETGLDAPYILSEREVEVLFGDYSSETVMMELKSTTGYYFKGGIFTPDDFRNVSDELLMEMMKEDDFCLYLFDMQNLGVHNPSQRVETLKSQMQEE